MNTLVMTSSRQHVHVELAGLAHELQNPLTTILGFSELLLSEGGSSADRLRKIHAEAERSVRIIQNVLRTARGDNGTYEVTDINESIRRTAELAECELVRHCITLELNLSSESPKVIAHGGQLTQVLLNLTTNAIQAISGARKSGLIRISSAVIRDRVHISVSDDGPGISQTHMHRLFEPFFTTKEKGTGLGLHLSQNIIREIGGDLWVSKAEPWGATFTIELPVTSAKDPQHESPSDHSVMVAANQSVLIVDDEDHITELIEAALGTSGYDTKCVNDGTPAIELLRRQEFDILICDLNMPGTSGREVIEWVRSNRPNVRTLLLSGNVSQPETEELARSCGAHFLAKPFHISELRQAVQRLSS